MWRINLIQSQREHEIPDTDVGKLLHQIKKYSANASLFGRKKTGSVFQNIKKVNSCIIHTPHRFKIKYLPVHDCFGSSTESVSQGSRYAITPTRSAIGELEK